MFSSLIAPPPEGYRPFVEPEKRPKWYSELRRDTVFVCPNKRDLDRARKKIWINN